MLIEDRETLNSILSATADELDIPDHVYEDATIKFEDVGEHLGAEDSPLVDNSPEIYVQGSFRLGTIVRPIDENGEYDIDQVCKLIIKKQNTTQSDLKKKIGDRLDEREDFRKILKESRRCWTLEYPTEPSRPAFHLDILPAIPNDERLPSGILISDKELRLWQKSNPVAYGEWFKDRMKVVFQKRAAALAESMSASIEDVPEWRVKTPLQRVVQILKRHRDIHFQSSSDEKPISIIITTLAGHAYQNEEDLYEALDSIVKRMPSFIEKRDGVWWVQNPVDPDENFADKWSEYPERRVAFLKWLEKVENDFKNMANATNLREGISVLARSVGESAMRKVASDFGVTGNSMVPTVASTVPTVPALASEAHVLPPESKFSIAKIPSYKAKVAGAVYFKSGWKKGKMLWPLTERPVPKDVWLRFSVKTNVPEPHTIEWQVTNTGEEAIADDARRGDFYESDDIQKRVRWETTGYRGTHWVRAFVLNSNGVCVAQTPKKLVKVR